MVAISPCRRYLSPSYLLLLATSAALHSSLAVLRIHHPLVLLWTGTSFLWNNNTLFKILFLSFSKPRIVNFKLLARIRVGLCKNTYNSNSLGNSNYHSIL